jgi:hypothetical protein
MLRGQGDGIVARRIFYLARKVKGPRLVRKSGQHRGLWGKLYDAEAYIDLPIEGVPP